jgi:CelD/BcsL family acetyltransferase involved in cellulose biosynthesis
MKARTRPVSKSEIRTLQDWPTFHDDLSRLRPLTEAGNSPFFAPQFFRILSEARIDVVFGVVVNGDSVVSILPLQHDGCGNALPGGFPLSDYQGVIGAPISGGMLRKLLREAGIRELFFNHIPVAQDVFIPYTRKIAASPIIDTVVTYSDFAAELKARSGEYSQAMRKLRQLERDAGPVSFEAISNDLAVFNQVISWKSQQYQRTGAKDMFQEEWFLNTVRATFEMTSESFKGVLSVLKAGNRTVAAHYGLISGTVWHYWFPAYDPEFGKYSPGLNLLLKMVQHACENDIRTIDLGKGDQVRYKELLKTSERTLAEGVVYSSRFTWHLQQLRRKLGALKRAIR